MTPARIIKLELELFSVKVAYISYIFCIVHKLLNNHKATGHLCMFLASFDYLVSRGYDLCSHLDDS